LSELERAARCALETHADIATLRRETFVLPTLGPRLTRLHDALIHGSVFALVRALPVQEWSREVIAAAFYGLGCHLGNPVPQNAKGHVLGHVMDMGLNANDPKVRIYQRQYIDSAQRFEDAMRLTPLHVEALDCFDALANDSQLNFLMRLEPGDMQFVHNHTLLHDRTAFEDWQEPGRKRHLLRLWLSSPEARPLPEIWAERYGSVEPGVRGGVAVPAASWIAPLYPDMY